MYKAWFSYGGLTGVEMFSVGTGTNQSAHYGFSACCIYFLPVFHMFCLSIIFHLGVELHFLLKTEVSVVVPVCSAMVVTTVYFLHSSTRNHINEVASVFPEEDFSPWRFLYCEASRNYIYIYV